MVFGGVAVGDLDDKHEISMTRNKKSSIKKRHKKCNDGVQQVPKEST